MNETAIYYYTGTGNSLWIARKIAEHTGQSDPVPMNRSKKRFFIAMRSVSASFFLFISGDFRRLLLVLSTVSASIPANIFLPRLLMPVRLLQHYYNWKNFSRQKVFNLTVVSPLTCQAIIYPGVGLSRKKSRRRSLLRHLRNARTSRP